MDKQITRVYKKEIMELLRDKRVRSSAILGPFIMVFAMMTMLGGVINATVKNPNVKVTIVGMKPEDFLAQQLKHAKDEKVTFVPAATVDEGKRLLLKGTTSIVVVPATAPVPGHKTEITAYYDSRSEKSIAAKKGMEDAIAEANKQNLSGVLKAHKIDDTIATPYELKPQDVTEGQGANSLLLSLIPYLVVFLAFVGGVSAASDLVAGEKERNTLETLLISPVPRTKIVIGKFLSLATICLSSSVSGLVAILIAASSHMPGTDVMFKNGSGVSAGAVLSIELVMIPTVALFASVLIAISSYAKNTREAQTYLSLGSIAVALPTVFSQFLGFTELGSSRMINFIPILNASAAIRNALMGTLDATSLAITASVSTAIALIAITIAVRLCNREEVLLRI